MITFPQVLVQLVHNIPFSQDDLDLPIFMLYLEGYHQLLHSNMPQIFPACQCPPPFISDWPDWK